MNSQQRHSDQFSPFTIRHHNPQHPTSIFGKWSLAFSSSIWWNLNSAVCPGCEFSSWVGCLLCHQCYWHHLRDKTKSPACSVDVAIKSGMIASDGFFRKQTSKRSRHTYLTSRHNSVPNGQCLPSNPSATSIPVHANIQPVLNTLFCALWLKEGWTGLFGQNIIVIVRMHELFFFYLQTLLALPSRSARHSIAPMAGRD
jgi:hypothetical protein